MRRRRPAAFAALACAALVAWGILRDGSSVIDSPADRHGARVATLTLDSRAVGDQVHVKVVVPPKAPDRGRALLVFLHGRSGDESSGLDDSMFASLKRLGPRAPVVAFPYGGDHSYWHDRDDGAWGRYVFDEVIPQVTRRFRTDPRRVAIGGISMGGFGAYDIARLHPGRFCAVGGHSPALWASSGETAPGAFDDADDFAAHDVVGAARTQPAAFAGLPVWLDAGDRDPFGPGDEAFTAALRASGAQLTSRTWPGGHEHGYWASHWRDYLRFYSAALRSCRPAAPGGRSS
jgi:S-formylglutathione hydrolase FrmB